MRRTDSARQCAHRRGSAPGSGLPASAACRSPCSHEMRSVLISGALLCLPGPAPGRCMSAEETSRPGSPRARLRLPTVRSPSGLMTIESGGRLHTSRPGSDAASFLPARRIGTVIPPALNGPPADGQPSGSVSRIDPSRQQRRSGIMAAATSALMILNFGRIR